MKAPTPLAVMAPLVFAWLLGAAMGANGVAMLWDPLAWYFAVPGVPATGPFNPHFIRDIGMIYLLIGAAFAAGAVRPDWRTLLWISATLWLGAHAVFHVWEVATGICTVDALPRDFLGVTLPALIGAGLTGWAVIHRGVVPPLARTALSR